MSNEKISAIAQKLWDIDENKLTRNLHYKLDLQKKVPKRKRNPDGSLDPNIGVDSAKPLFKFLDEKYIFGIPTYRNFFKLFDNYNSETDCAEKTNPNEEKEQDDFLNACMKTKLMKEAHKFLVSEGKAPKDEKDFVKFLDEIWFDFYSRDGDKCEDSSGFEHVFVGEKRSKDSKVLGFHNWFDYYFLEKKGIVDYLGYIPVKTIYEDITTQDPCIVAISFSIGDLVKPLGGFIVGSSPEFELALYTVIFLCGEEKTYLKFANIEISFDCFKMFRKGRKVIGTLYPNI